MSLFIIIVVNTIIPQRVNILFLNKMSMCLLCLCDCTSCIIMDVFDPCELKFTDTLSLTCFAELLEDQPVHFFSYVGKKSF